jgi:hypothetical protein
VPALFAAPTELNISEAFRLPNTKGRMSVLPTLTDVVLEWEEAAVWDGAALPARR